MILLSECAQGGEEYKVEIETYCKDLILDSDNVFKTDVVITQSEIAAINRPAWISILKLRRDLTLLWAAVRSTQDSVSCM